MIKDDELNHLIAEMEAQIARGGVHRRKCDICGSEIDVPDIGPFTRGFFICMACTTCTDSKPHHTLLEYIKDLMKRNYTKTEVQKILDKRMEETWGLESSVFTTDEFHVFKQTRSIQIGFVGGKQIGQHPH